MMKSLMVGTGFCFGLCGMINAASDYPVKPVPFTEVRFTQGVFASRQATNRVVTIPFGLEQCEKSGRMKNFDLAAEVIKRRSAGESTFQNKPVTTYPFDDSDVFKALEGVAYSLQTNPDPVMLAKAEDLIKRIAAAQEADGYLYTFRTMHPDTPVHGWIDPIRWKFDPALSHELYNLGHFYEFATAYIQATGSKLPLDVALKSAELVNKDLGTGEPRIPPGHQVIEMGLVKLYRQTGDERWLKLAKQMLANRGTGGEYSQNHKPVIEQTEAVGHAVRANYMYAGMADIAAIMGDQAYKTSVVALWDNVVTKKIHLTGGCGARGAGEAYGNDYELPNSCYNETCAALGFLFWTHRMFLLTGEGKYMDVFERSLYNGSFSGISLSGDRFFYPNTLEYDGKSKNNHGHAGRAPWFGCACCPPNVMRTIASLGNYAYATKDDRIYVNLYNSGTMTWKGVVITQETQYPWEGNVALSVATPQPVPFTLALRIPGWVRGQTLPSDLYRYEKPALPEWSIKVNGQPLNVDKIEQGYAVIQRTWKEGDKVELSLPMTPHRVRANEKIPFLKNQVAFERGPIVFAFEGLDQPADSAWRKWTATEKAVIKAVYQPELLTGVMTLEITEGSQKMRGIPYAYWANRTMTPMRVWLSDGTKVETAYPNNVATEAKVSVSFTRGMSPDVINDEVFPQNPTDAGFANFDFWPHNGTAEWVQYSFEKPVTVSKAKIIWFDDSTRGGGCRVPESWKLFYQNATGEWTSVSTVNKTDSTIDFTKVTTKALKLNLKLKANVSGGLYEWILE
jgi:DUF1680 family protein